MTIAQTVSSPGSATPRWLLLGSLALNLFFIGVAIAFVIRTPAPAAPADRSDAARIERLVAADPAARIALERARQIDDLLARHFRHDELAAPASAARVLAALATKPLPRQRGKLLSRWPDVLLSWDFTPAWPRVAALAGCAVLGFAIGLAGLGPHFEPGATTIVAADLSSIVFEPEPLTGLRP